MDYQGKTLILMGEQRKHDNCSMGRCNLYVSANIPVSASFSLSVSSKSNCFLTLCIILICFYYNSLFYNFHPFYIIYIDITFVKLILLPNTFL